MILETVTQFVWGGEPEFPGQPRPGVAAHRPPLGAQLRDIAASPGIAEGSACGTVTGLTTASYVFKQKDRRRNLYQIQAHARGANPPARNPPSADRTSPGPPQPRRCRA